MNTKYSIVGSVTQGYTICEMEEPLPLHFTQMWDAILTKDKLNSGEWTLAPLFLSRPI